MSDLLSRLSRTGIAELGEQAEIHSLQESLPVAKAWPALLPGEITASLPEQDYPVDPAQQMLSGLLGRRLSVDSAAWSGDPVPRMRALQKKLIEFSLTQNEAERRPCMEAIRVVELAVNWRLRWQQMRRSELEGEAGVEPSLTQQQESSDAEKDHA